MRQRHRDCQAPAGKKISPSAHAFARRRESGSAAIEKIAAAPMPGNPNSLAKACQSERPELDLRQGGDLRWAADWDSAENFSCWIPSPASCMRQWAQSRAAVDAGYVPNDYQVGQTGKAVARSCTSLGISGPSSILAGHERLPKNRRHQQGRRRPIFQVADYGLVGDLFKDHPRAGRRTVQTRLQVKAIPWQLRIIGVVGAGQMGTGIAHVLALAAMTWCWTT